MHCFVKTAFFFIQAESIIHCMKTDNTMPCCVLADKIIRRCGKADTMIRSYAKANSNLCCSVKTDSAMPCCVKADSTITCFKAGSSEWCEGQTSVLNLWTASLVGCTGQKSRAMQPNRFTSATAVTGQRNFLLLILLIIVYLICLVCMLHLSLLIYDC